MGMRDGDEDDGEDGGVGDHGGVVERLFSGGIAHGRRSRVVDRAFVYQR